MCQLNALKKSLQFYPYKGSQTVSSSLNYLVIIYLLLMPACASVTALDSRTENEAVRLTSESKPELSEPLAANNVPTGDKGWWAIRFRIDWPQETEVTWNVDVYLAHKIIKPLLVQYRPKLDLWRFHRRAARDAAGHQFSFIFYTSGEMAELIATTIRNDKQLAIVESAGLISRVQYPDTSVNKQPNISDTSDASWSKVVQDSWPYYIMGASEMWLRMIDDIASHEIAKYEIDSYEDILDFYNEVDKAVTDIWQAEGSHAFLHHLNALFGYKDTIVLERKYMRF